MSVPYANATSGASARDEITKVLRRFGCEIDHRPFRAEAFVRERRGGNHKGGREGGKADKTAKAKGHRAAPREPENSPNGIRRAGNPGGAFIPYGLGEGQTNV